MKMMNKYPDSLPVAKRNLLAAAEKALANAYAPYSRYRVGAAVLTAGGRIFTGCNVENASYGVTICAERVAAAAAVAAGERKFAALAVVTDDGAPAPPCGLCRQFLVEFSPDLPVLMANRRGDLLEGNLLSYLPGAFTGEFLPGKGKNKK